MSADQKEAESVPVSEPAKVVFIKKPKKNLRQRRNSDEDHAEVDKESLEEIKERQKLRQRPRGVSAVALTIGKKLAPEEEVTIKDPFKVASGGLVNMKAVKSGAFQNQEDPYEITIGTQFSAETNKRDEDEEMMKYIERELAKRKGMENTVNEDDQDGKRYFSPEEAALLSLPEHLRQSSSSRSEEMLSNQMLNGIPEVDLGIEAKIRNIEATEEAKISLMEKQRNRKDLPSAFVPTNMAVNFMQHNRFNIEEPVRKKKPDTARETYGPNGVKRASDDFVYDKFKKQYRRY